jgi:hypothetical protein
MFGKVPGVGMKVVMTASRLLNQRLRLKRVCPTIAAGIIAGLAWAGPVLLPAWAQTPTQNPQPAPADQVPAGPMSREEVAERLNIVPVFTIVSKDGTPILANIDKDGKTIQVASFFLDQNQAQETIKQIQTSSPDIAAQAQVLPMSLGYAYEVAEQEKPKGSNIVFQVLPRQVDIQSAMEILKQNGQADVTDFPGVPLFYGISDQGLLTIEKDGIEVVPFFFDRTDLNNALQRAGGANPEILQKTKIEVTTLEQVVDSMLEAGAKPDVHKIAFVPAKASLEYIKSITPNQGTAPAPASAAPAPTP